jgi:hypothetical protein
VRVIELVDLEATVQCGQETHGIDGLVHRFLDEERRHRRQLRDPASEFDCVVGQFFHRRHVDVRVGGTIAALW